MKDLNLIVWITQLGMSVAIPLAGFILLAVWLRNQFGLGNWIVWIGVGIGLVTAIDGFRHSLKLLEKMSHKKKDQQPPPVSFNDHD